MKAFIFRIIIIAALSLLVAACGNKGDLYIPEKTDDVSQTKS